MGAGGADPLNDTGNRVNNTSTSTSNSNNTSNTSTGGNTNTSITITSNQDNHNHNNEHENRARNRPRRRAAAQLTMQIIQDKDRDKDKPHSSTQGQGQTNSDDGPDTFEPTVDMMVHDFDDERTLDEEEALAACEKQDPRAELSSLRREGDMPLEELLALYGLDRNAPERDRPPPPAPPPPPSLPPPTTSQQEPEPPDDEKPEPSALRRLYEETDGPTGAEPSRFLRSVSRPQSEEEDDCDYSPEETEEAKKTIMVGGNYQAWIPEGLCSYDDALPYENEDKLLWNPAELDENQTEEYMRRAKMTTEEGDETAEGGMAADGGGLPCGDRLRDDEQALFLLQQCGHNVEEALRRRRIAVAGAPPAAMSPWSEEECRNFENGLKAHGKDFHLIQQHRVRTRSVGELVQFYYIWKKTERHDMFANRARLEKKKYVMHPGHTDYMDRFLEEQDSANRDRDRDRERENTPSPAALPKPASDAPPDPLAVGREVFSELPRSSPAASRSADDTDHDENCL